MTDPVARLDPASLRGLPEDVLDERLRAFANEHGAGALPALSGLAEGTADRAVRRAAKRALYRLSQRGVVPAPPPPPAPVVQRRAPRAVRAWLSGIDGSGSRAAWILFEGPYGGGALCSLILNDVVGITEVARGEITKRRLEAELASLPPAPKLPWGAPEPPRGLRPDQGRAPGGDPRARGRARVRARGAAPLGAAARRDVLDLQRHRPARASGDRVGRGRGVRRERSRASPPSTRAGARPARPRAGLGNRGGTAERLRWEPEALITDGPGIRVGPATDLTGLPRGTGGPCD